MPLPGIGDARCFRGAGAGRDAAYGLDSFGRGNGPDCRDLAYRQTVAELNSGQRDHQLVYRKRLRRPLEEYREANPPHVQAARKSKRPGRWVRYIVTRSGPEPVDNNPSPPDYEHYLDKQLAPAADALLRWKDTSVRKIVDAQMSLF